MYDEFQSDTWQGMFALARPLYQASFSVDVLPTWYGQLPLTFGQSMVCTSLVRFSTTFHGHEYSGAAVIGNKVSICSAMYSTNRCTAPVPAMVAQCMEWQACVDQSILAISHTQVVAQVLIGILNSLAEPLSTKSFVRITVTPWFPPNQ